MAGKNWIKGAIKHPGALRKQAKASGQTVDQYCAGKTKGNSTTAKRCRLAKTLKGMRRK